MPSEIHIKGKHHRNSPPWSAVELLGLQGSWSSSPPDVVITSSWWKRRPSANKINISPGTARHQQHYQLCISRTDGRTGVFATSVLLMPHGAFSHPVSMFFCPATTVGLLFGLQKKFRKKNPFFSLQYCKILQ